MSHRIMTMAAILTAHPGISAAAQRRRLLLALEALGSVTTYEGSRYLDLYDPRARKKELCKEGVEIDTIPARVVTESGEVHRIGRYVLKSQAIQKVAA
ncbi:MAG TPA: helix-turn-helix domain-containing protein [Fluviicoccus sp.]|nr:helix-turn-helix domain-containing protein [Fluviicoccus sp.]